MAHYEPPPQDLSCLQIQLFSSLVVKELIDGALAKNHKLLYKYFILSKFCPGEAGVKKLCHGLSTCTGDNSHNKAPGLSPRKGGQTVTIEYGTYPFFIKFEQADFFSFFSISFSLIIYQIITTVLIQMGLFFINHPKASVI